MNDDKRFILAIVLSVGILIGFQFFHVRPAVDPHQVIAQEQKAAADALAQQKATGQIAAASEATTFRPRADIIKEGARVQISTPELLGSINLKGGLIDDLHLVKYRESTEANSPQITLLSPVGSAAPYKAYHAEFGWLDDGKMGVPNADTVWKTQSTTLAPNHNVTLSWENGAGLVFERVFAVDEHFMFTVTDRVRNASSSPVTLYPFALVARRGVPEELIGKSSVVHEGPVGVLGGTLQEYEYSKLAKEKKVTEQSTGGWIGITDKYWLVALIPAQDEKLTGDFTYSGADKFDPENGRFQSDYRGAEQTVEPGATVEHSTMLFAGAKSVDILDDYTTRYNITHLDKAIDFGRLYYLAKPFLYIVDAIGKSLGSIGMAILIFTVMLKLITLPLSLKSYHSKAKMKALQPEIAKIQAQYADDKPRQSQEVMAFYSRQKVNPMAGCLPTLIQIPIFFALYKVLYVSLEMRQAPFYGWIRDMSAPDPTSIFTLFGYMPWPAPSFLHMGVWPVLMGISMFLQQKLSPQPADKAQAQMFTFMPIIFTFMLAQMPAGLVIYWTWSNLLGIAQQWYIMRQDAKKKIPVT